MKIRPLHDFVLVEREHKVEEKTAGGIIVPSDATYSGRASEVVLVVAVGPGRQLEDGTRVPVCVAPGAHAVVDRSLVDPDLAKDRLTPDEHFVFVREGDLHGLAGVYQCAGCEQVQYALLEGKLVTRDDGDRGICSEACAQLALKRYYESKGHKEVVVHEGFPETQGPVS